MRLLTETFGFIGFWERFVEGRDAAFGRIQRSDHVPRPQLSRSTALSASKFERQSIIYEADTATTGGNSSGELSSLEYSRYPTYGRFDTVKYKAWFLKVVFKSCCAYPRIVKIVTSVSTYPVLFM